MTNMWDLNALERWVWTNQLQGPVRKYCRSHLFCVFKCLLTTLSSNIALYLFLCGLTICRSTMFVFTNWIVKVVNWSSVWSKSFTFRYLQSTAHLFIYLKTASTKYIMVSYFPEQQKDKSKKLLPRTEGHHQFCKCIDLFKPNFLLHFMIWAEGSHCQSPTQYDIVTQCAK